MDKASEKYNKQRDDLSKIAEDRVAENTAQYASAAFTSLSNAEQERIKAENEINLKTIKDLIAQIPLQTEIARSEAAKSYVNDSKSGFDKAQKAGIAGESDAAIARSTQQLTALEKNQNTERETNTILSGRKETYLELVDVTQKENLLLDARKAQLIASFQASLDINNSSRVELDRLRSISAITEQQYLDKVQALTISNAQIERDKGRTEILHTSTKEIQAATDKMIEQGAEGKDASRVQLAGIVLNRDTQLNALDEEYIKRKNLANIERQNQTEIAKREVAYNDIFIQGINGMADAFVEFAKTGKLSFKGLIDTMLADLLRYELRQNLVFGYDSMGGARGIMSFFGLATTSPGSVGVSSPMGAVDYGLKGGKLAQGGVYDAGLRKFSMGGAFTNSIVNDPTLFKFAHGTGLMGEAGPEAIMPLKRDNNGNLGVRSGQQGNVDVVVNNYSNQQATTKETTDSRGNRRIEVIVGDMVAGELNRVGSTTQQAMTASYGTSPLLARR
jgi:hypothetical protein